MRRAIVGLLLAAMSVALAAQNRVSVPPPPRPPRATLSMVVPLSHARYFGSAELWIQNRGSDPQPMTFLWTTDRQQRVEGPGVSLDPMEIQFIDVASLLPEGVTLANVAGLELKYQGRRATEVTAWLMFHPQAGSPLSQSVEVPISLPEDVRGATLDTTWPAPRGNERAIVAVLNTSPDPVVVHVTQRAGTETIKLEGFGSRLIDRPAASPPGRGEWMRLETPSRTPSPLRAAGFVRSVDDRIPHMLRFHDATDALVDDVFATGIHAANTSMMLSLANVSDIAQTATAVLTDTTGAVTMASVSIPLAPKSVEMIDLGARVTHDGATALASLRIGGRGPKGSLLPSLHVVDRGTGLAHDPNFSDVLRGGGSAGWYVWRLDGTWDSAFTVANFGTAGSFTWSLRDRAESYSYGIQKLGSGATFTVDLRGHRAAERPDGSPRKRVMPLDLMFGQLHWSRGGPGSDLGLLGQLELVNLKRRIVRVISDQ
ncbi:MAG TPA: hypothetical protein VMS54_10850 [Vicinamibacterales bacterium]|nr:hypothetical protein [Vicinamibacterales bacterium]